MNDDTVTLKAGSRLYDFPGKPGWSEIHCITEWEPGYFHVCLDELGNGFIVREGE